MYHLAMNRDIGVSYELCRPKLLLHFEMSQMLLYPIGVLIILSVMPPVPATSKLYCMTLNTQMH